MLRCMPVEAVRHAVLRCDFWRQKAAEHVKWGSAADSPERRARHILAAAEYFALAEAAEAAARRPLPRWARPIARDERRQGAAA
jgi:hypothetical protein